MGRARSFLVNEEGGVGPVVLLGLVGGVVGVPVGALVASLVWEAICSVGPMGSLGNDDRCGLEGMLFFLVGVPTGAMVGAVTGALVGSRRPRSLGGSPPRPGNAHELPLFAGPPVHREATMSSWIAVAAGLAICYGTFAHWRSVSIPREDFGRYVEVLTSGPEGLGVLGGLLVLLAGTLRVLRPAAPAPTAMMGIGACLTALGLLWALVDLLGLPDEVNGHVFVGYWFTLAGAIVSFVGWFVDRRTQADRAGTAT